MYSYRSLPPHSTVLYRTSLHTYKILGPYLSSILCNGTPPPRSNPIPPPLFTSFFPCSLPCSSHVLMVFPCSYVPPCAPSFPCSSPPPQLTSPSAAQGPINTTEWTTACGGPSQPLPPLYTLPSPPQIMPCRSICRIFSAALSLRIFSRRLHLPKISRCGSG
jgi:hypothetical protein